jgi:hypothetical protein
MYTHRKKKWAENLRHAELEFVGNSRVFPHIWRNPCFRFIFFSVRVKRRCCDDVLMEAQLICKLGEPCLHVFLVLPNSRIIIKCGHA